MLEIVRVIPFAESGEASGFSGVSALLQNSTLEFCPFVSFVPFGFDCVAVGSVDGPGDGDLADAGCAIREPPVGGLPDRGMPPGRGRDKDGDAGLPMPPVSREICDGCGARASFPNSRLSGVLGPATRRSLSSSWVLSLGLRDPT